MYTNQFRGEFTLKIKGKNVKGVFNMNALRLTLKGEGIALDGFDKFIQGDPLTAIPAIAYYSILSSHMKDNKKFGMGMDQFIAEFYEVEGAMDEVLECIQLAMGGDDEAQEEGN